MRVILQQTEQDCLLACYAMVLDHLGTRVNPGALRDWRPLPADGLSVGFLRDLNARHGLEMRVLRADAGAPSLDQAVDLPVPFLAHWGGNHFVVVEKITRRFAVVVDPALGRLRLAPEQFEEKFAGVIVLLSPSPDFTPRDLRDATGPGLRSILPARAVLILSIGLVLAQVVTLGSAAGVRELMQASRPDAGVAVALLVGVLALIAAGLALRVTGQRMSSAAFEESYTRRLFRGLLAQPLSYFQAQSPGTLLEKLGLRLLLKDAVILTVLPSVLSLLSIVVVLGYLTWVSPLLTSVLVGCSAVYVLTNAWLVSRLREANQTYVQAQIDLAARTQSALQNIDAVKATGQEELTGASWEDANGRTARQYEQVLRFNGASGSLQLAYITVTLIVVIWVGMVLAGEGSVSMADIVLFQTGLAMFAGLLAETQSLVMEIANIGVYREKQSDMWSPGSLEGEVKTADAPGVVDVSGFGFGYPGSDRRWEDISFRLEAGSKTAVVGPSGAGKSTLLYAMLGLIDFEGELRVGSDGFRDRTGVLFPRMTLVDGTVRENLLLGESEDPGDEALWRTLDAVNMLEAVGGLPGGLDSRIREGGTNVSTGQAQRLLLARSLLRGREFILWDEALSSLDQENRDLIYRRVLSGDEYRHVTVVVVSHDPAVVGHCDQVLRVGSDRCSVVLEDTPDRRALAGVSA